MNNLRKLFTFGLCLFSISTFAQVKPSAKQKYFTDYPQTVQLSKNILQNTLGASEGEEVIIAFSSDFRFKGVVMSNQQKYHNLQSVMIKSSVFGNSIFQLSKIINEDKSISYSGRIINPEAADGYEIKQDMNGNYSFVKFETKSILQDCSYQ